MQPDLTSRQLLQVQLALKRQLKMIEGARPRASVGALEQKEGVAANKGHDLLIVTMILDGKECKWLIDSGATHNLASWAWVEKHNLITIEEDEDFSVVFAGDRQQKSKTVKTTRRHLRMGQFHGEKLFAYFRREQLRFDLR